MFGAVGVAFLRLDFFQLHDIEVRGAQTVNASQIREEVEAVMPYRFLFIPTENALLIPRQEIVERIQKRFVGVRTATIRQPFFDADRIILEIQEREPSAVWCKENADCYFVDREGIAFLEASTNHSFAQILVSTPLDISLGSQVAEQEQLEPVLDFYEAVSQGNFAERMGFSIVSLTSQPAEKLEALASEGWTLIFTAQEDLFWQATKARAALQEKVSKDDRTRLEYIDVRFGDQAFVKYKD